MQAYDAHRGSKFPLLASGRLVCLHSECLRLFLNELCKIKAQRKIYTTSLDSRSFCDTHLGSAPSSGLGIDSLEQTVFHHVKQNALHQGGSLHANRANNPFGLSLFNVFE